MHHKHVGLIWIFYWPMACGSTIWLCTSFKKVGAKELWLMLTSLTDPQHVPMIFGLEPILLYLFHLHDQNDTMIIDSAGFHFKQQKKSINESNKTFNSGYLMKEAATACVPHDLKAWLLNAPMNQLYRSISSSSRRIFKQRMVSSFEAFDKCRNTEFVLFTQLINSRRRLRKFLLGQLAPTKNNLKVVSQGKMCRWDMEQG